MPKKSNQVVYFGFGANTKAEMIRAITGEKAASGSRAFIEGYKLIVQDFKDVPSVKKNGVSPQQIIKRSWGTKFQSYQMARSNDKKSRVYGTAWLLTRKQWKDIQRWELVPEGWTKEVPVLAHCARGVKKKAFTEIVSGRQSYQKVVSGKNYKPFIVSKKKIQKIAKAFQNPQA